MPGIITPTRETQVRKRATFVSVGAGIALFAVVAFSVFLLITEQNSRRGAWEAARGNDALFMANRLIRFSLALDSTVLMRSETPSLIQLANLAVEPAELEAGLAELASVRPDLSANTGSQLKEGIEQINRLAIQRNDLLMLRNNLDVAVRENVTVYQDDATLSSLVSILREATQADTLILIGELSRQFTLELGNAQINANLASRLRQLAYAGRGVFPVSEDLILVNEQINQNVQSTQRLLESLIERLQSQPYLARSDLSPGSAIQDWRSQLLALLIIVLSSFLFLMARFWRQYLNNAHQVNRLESLGQISGHVAHDISNMISITISSLSILKDHPDPADKRHQQTLDNALFAADKSVGIIDRLLTFARRNRLSPELCSVNELIEGLKG